jgi:hypothetical protein
MRRTVIGAIVFVIAVAGTAGAQPPRTLDDPIGVFFAPNPLPPCGIATALLQLGRAANVLMGFERTPECSQDPNWFPDPSGQTLDNLSGLTVRQALDHLIMLAPEFEWRDMNGIGVVRPFNAWNDANNPLNAHRAGFTLTNGRLVDGIANVLQKPNLAVVNIAPASMANRRFSMAFAGGTVVDALNAVIRGHDGAVWDLGARPGGQNSGGGLDLMIRAFDASGFSVGTSF